MLVAPSRAALRCSHTTAARAVQVQQLPGELFFAIRTARLHIARNTKTITTIHDTSRSASLLKQRCASNFTKRTTEAPPAKDVKPTVSKESSVAQKPYNIFFAGTDEFSCTVFRALASQGSGLINEMRVLTPHPAKVGRNYRDVVYPPMHMLARQLGYPLHEIPYEQNGGLKNLKVPPPFNSEVVNDDTAGRIVPSPHNLLISASFGHLLPPSVTQHFLPKNTINLHPSLLPKYRGASPIQQAILDGVTETGVTVQTLGESFDTGDILAQKAVSVSQFVTYIRARDLLADAGKELLIEVLRDLPEYQKNAKPLDLSQGSLAPKFTKKQAKISWRNQTAGDIMRQHRAIGYKYPLWTIYKERRMQIHEMRPTTVPPEIYDEERPGTAHLDKRTGIMNVKCKDNTWLAVNIVQMESKNEQNASRWWHGYRQGLESAIFDM